MHALPRVHAFNALSECGIVCACRSVAEDSAARAFAVGFYGAIAEQLQHEELLRQSSMLRQSPACMPMCHL